MRWLLPSLLFALLSQAAFAQQRLDNRQDLDFDRPESWGMKWVTSVALLTSFGAPEDAEAGTFDLAFEAGWVPSLSKEERTIGFNGRKEEDMNKTSVFGRPRFVFGLPAKLTLTLSWLPPIEVAGVEANLVSASLGRPWFSNESWRVGSRLYAQFGTIEGDLTCSEDVVAAGNDPERNPFNCLEKSNDEVTQNYVGADITASYKLGDWEPHFGLSVNHMDLEFQVNSRYGNFEDHNLLVTDGITWAVTAGAGYQMTERIRVGGELFYTPLDVVRSEGASKENDGLFNFRVLASYRLRQR